MKGRGRWDQGGGGGEWVEEERNLRARVCRVLFVFGIVCRALGGKHFEWV